MGAQRHYVEVAYAQPLCVAGPHGVLLFAGPAPGRAMSSPTWSSSVASEAGAAAQPHHLTPQYPSAIFFAKVWKALQRRTCIARATDQQM